jgi:hypothetical protein
MALSSRRGFRARALRRITCGGGPKARRMTSAIAPAVSNAIFAAIGKPLRKSPIDTAALKEPV